MAAGLQLRLLLWKDYLIRKRKPITLAGVVWATLVMLSLVVVRINIDNKDYPTCQFAARALPSAGVLNFLQSFVCNVNNDCSPMEEFEEIPAYEKSRFTQIQRQITPLINNASVIDTVSSAPDALKLLATLADIADNPIFADITKNGLHVNDLFRNSKRVKRFISKQLHIPEEVSDSILSAEIGFEGILQGGLDRCNAESILRTIRIKNVQHLEIFVYNLCKLEDKVVQNLVMSLLLEVDLGKYVTMVGEMYTKLSGDDRITRIGDMLVAVLRMTSQDSFLPPEIASIFQGKQPDFSYIDMNMITKFMDLFEPTFGETESYKSLRELIDSVVIGIEYLNKFVSKNLNSVEEVTDVAFSNVGNMLGTNKGFKRLSLMLGNVADVISEMGGNDTSPDVFNILSRLTNFILKWLPDSYKHDVLFYSSLLAKLIEGSEKVIDINIHIEELAYNVSLRNPLGIKILLSLKPDIVKKGLEALADPERIQILTSKMNNPGVMFCDVNRLKNFFLISKEEATELKGYMCTDAWKNYTYDLMSTFGIYDVKNNINSMASLFVLETLGKDISDQLYSIEKDFEILKNFTYSIKRIETDEKPAVVWAQVFKIPDDSKLLQVFRNKSYLGKHMLITVHGALAKEVVSQNPLLEYKISPTLKSIITMLNAINEELDKAPQELHESAKKLYPDIILTILKTALDEEKSYRALSTSCIDIFCNGPKTASMYLNLPANIDEDDLVTNLCNITIAIEDGLKKESTIGKAIKKIKTKTHSPLEEINWTKMITNLNNLYEKLNNNYTYLFEYKTYGMDEELQKNVSMMMKEATDFWFSLKNFNRMLHISIKLGLRFLDFLDRGIFDINSEIWLKLKHSFGKATGPMIIVDDLVQLIAGISRNNTDPTDIPPLTASALREFLPFLPNLIVDSVDLVKADTTDIAPIITILNADPPWPCTPFPTESLSTETRTAVAALETLLCMNADMRNEWKNYLSSRNATIFKSNNWNTTTYPDNLFLKFSGAFDNLIKDFELVKDIFEVAFDEPEDGHMTLATALTYAINNFNTTDKEIVLGKFFTKVDTVLNSINSSISEDVPLNTLWEMYLNCTTDELDCKMIARAVWKNTFIYLSVAGGNITDDLLTYFTESSGENATLLQMLGFTKSTGLYYLYDKLPDFVAVLINSYFDLGFLNQVRRASQTQFWDCEEMLMSLDPGPDSPVDMTTLKRVLPIVCPSLLHWLSMPRGDNKLIDIFTKPQYLFFTLEASNLSSTYENAYTKANALANLLKDMSTKNKSISENFNLDTMKHKLARAVDIVLSYEIKDTDPYYVKFNEANRKHFTMTIYLIRVVTIVNKMATAFDNITISAITPKEDMRKLQEELTIIQKIFKRRPSEVIEFHFDLLTDMLWSNKYNITDALKDSCDRLNNKDHSKDILVELDRVKAQICAKRYDVFYDTLQSIVDDDYDIAKTSLLNVVETLKPKNENVTDITKFFNERKKVVNVLQKSIKYSYDLSIPIYLKYLQNNLKHYDILLGFLSGDNWWLELRKLYNGSKSNNFFDTVEKGFEIAEDVLTHLDKIHLIRLIRDLNSNDSNVLCAKDTSLSDYLPADDALIAMRTQLCDDDFTSTFAELPPLVFASQGFNDKLKMSNDVDYTALNTDISNTESKLELIKNGPRAPKRPLWVTEERLSSLRHVANQLLSRESLIKISFGVLSNVVDAGTLFLNNSLCTYCSEFTTWVKQLNLQLYKKQEYDNLLCSIDQMTLEETYSTLKNDFHWDMAISELISTRNYTKYELNKSLNELLEQIKLHLLDDVSANSTKLSQCLAANITGNTFGHAALFAKVLARTAKLLIAELPHLQEVPGITELSYLKRLHTSVAHTLTIKDILSNYLINAEEFSKNLVKFIDDKNLVKSIEGAEINLLLINELEPTNDCFYIEGYSWDDICMRYECDDILSIVNRHLNVTLAGINIPKLQTKEFWRFNFISTIISHMGVIMDHVSRVLGVISTVDMQGVMEGRLETLLDTGLQLMMDDTFDSIQYSILGVLEEFKPILQDTDLDFDVNAVAYGLKILHQFKNYIIEEDIRVNISQIFSNPERIESDFKKLGINNTNFWSIAAPNIQAGYISLKPLLNQMRGSYHIKRFICDLDAMSSVLPADEDALEAIKDQFCSLADQQAKDILPILLANIDFKMVFNKVKTFLLTKLYIAANLMQAEGDAVLSQFGKMAALIPEIQTNIGNITASLAKEPLLIRMKKSVSVSDMLGSPDFLTDAGKMLCGKPFYTDLGRFYKAIAQTPDLTAEPDQAQLNALPTDFCRSLYKDIISMDGGKIVWSFIKPLIVGRILYTPSSPAVQRIIEKANGTFAPMVKVANLVHSFADSFSSVDKLNEHRNGLDALNNLLTVPQYSALRETLLGDVQAPNIDVNGLFEEFGDTQALGSILRKTSDLLHCINLNRFKPIQDEHELTQEAARLTMINEFSAGLVFMNMNETKSEIPSKIEYKIRMDIENAPVTKRLRNYLWTPGPESNFIENMRYFRGFVQIQDIIDKAIIELSADNSRRIQKREIAENRNDWAVYTQQIPYPCYRRDFFQTSLYESQSTIVAFFFSLLFTVSSAVRFIVSDKETGNTMLMSVMGVNLSYHTLSWFVWSYVEMVVTAGCVTAVLTVGQVLPRTDPTLVLALMLLYGFSVLSFCYMISTLFTVASVAAVVAGIAYLISFMPFVLILSLEAVLSSSLKTFVSLSMSSSLCYAFLFITRFEAMGVGAGWSQIWEAPDNSSDMNIGIAGIMVFVDGVIYIIVGYILNRFLGVKCQSNITTSQAKDEKAGVSIINVSKIYNKGSRRAKLALDNVSMELQKGQITTLLGHNGAGKTTLINILMGTLQPTNGEVLVRADGVGGARLGVCPQKDVLLEYMTAREHVVLYAQLKSGKSAADVRDEVESIVRVLSLGEVCDTAVARLSGGTRRRLCVALAFVAQPDLVSLDEPTAGVDPAARRDIWSMIMRLRENRTILLTTHHLDEAELLSDQIIIMHKGQIHTTGSPIEIKRTLGTGYKLTVMYPDKRLHPLEESENEIVSIEEKTKELLTVVRSTIKNAYLADMNGLEVEINLPFHDADGVSNNFLELCSSLESVQDVLGYRSVSVDCSSLEQVFYNICRRADTTHTTVDCEISSVPESSKSASTSSIKNDQTPLVPPDGPLKGSAWQQFVAILYARYLHYLRNRLLLFLLIVLPSLFITVAMGFSTIRPPADAEISLKLYPEMYEESTQFIIPQPLKYSTNIDSTLSQSFLDTIIANKVSRNWTIDDSPTCKCVDAVQQCEQIKERQWNRPELMLLPDVNTLNDWLIDSQQVYIEKRYGGFSSVIKDNLTHLIAWYNNKGHHALPAYINTLNSALLRVVTGNQAANITVYTHPLKISKEQLNRDTVYQHIADAGISGMLLVAYALAGAGGAVYLVTARADRRAALLRLCGVPPLTRCLAALLWDVTIIAINMSITAVVLQIFQFPVFVARNNLPAICILILLYGYACANMMHVLERAFTEPSLANMLLFCGNAFIGLVGITILLILDVISESDATDHARWVLHKILMLSPQFTLGDGLLEIAKNTIQAQVLSQFGMDTYRDPLKQNVVGYHYIALFLVGTVLFLLNLAIEYDCFDVILVRLRSNNDYKSMEEIDDEPPEVTAEDTRVRAALQPLRLRTIGNINAGFVDSEDIVKKGSVQRVNAARDVCSCVRLRKMRGQRLALRGLSLGIPPGQCTALLGENGAGKSTTFSLLTGEIRPTSGDIYLNSRNVNTMDLSQGLISYCPQSDAIDPLLTVKETLILYCRLRGIQDREEVIRRTIELFELGKYTNVRSGSLSGGNKRKLCTAIAFMGRSPLILLDEPTSGMDPLSRRCVSAATRAATGAGRGALLSTHALDDARRLAARVALLKQGRLCALATLDDCLRRFGGGYVVACRVRRGAARGAWRRVRARCGAAALRVLHHATLHFLLPKHATVDGKEVETKLSDVFRLLADLQMSCDIEDYTVNQSSLDQMFLNFSERTSILDGIDDPLPTPRLTRRGSDELDSVTSL